MAIRERLLGAVEKSQKIIVKRKASADYEKAVFTLKKAKTLCQQGLPQNSFNLYAEIFDGLILACNELATAKSKDSKEIKNLCADLFKLLTNQIQNETKFKKEIFFLPYKASMWDSLESVWKAADEDKEHCLAYVMPIPYADRNPDMSLTEFHCERSQFPSYVPTLDWQKVDLQAWHPDIIFFHNPYDYQNNVTSVMEKYYSVNLKLCADKLVYIPYFVTGGKTIAEHFCEAPGVLNADHVIVESEEIKEIYERVHRKYSEPAPDKFLALGSPKYDKVMNAKKEDYPLPPEWEKIIEGRKVILYLTSLNAFLQHPNNMLDKLVSVLEFFKKRTDIAFWWRPHPLMEATIASRSPQIAEVYRKIVRLFIEEGWGIFDDTAELDRAICYSDAYYGDFSSVVNLYKIIGKPFLIQDYLNLPYKPYWMFDVVLDENNKLWFNSPVINAICSVDLNTRNFNIEHVFSNKDFISDEIWSYALIQKVGNSLFLSPFLSRDIYIYNMDTQKELLIHLDEKLVNNDIKFYGCVSKKDRLLFFGRVPLIVEYHVKTQKLVYHVFDEEYEHIFKSAFLGYSPYVELGDDLWIVLANSNLLVRFNCENYTIFHYEVGNSNDEYHYITTDGRYFYMSTRYSHLVRWDMNNNETVRYNFDIEKSTEPYNIYFSGIVFTGAKVLLFPAFHNSCAKKIIIFDPNSETSEYLDISELGYRGYLLVKGLSNGDVIAYEPGVSEFHIYDNLGRLKEKCAVKISSCDLEKWNSELLKKGSWIFEQTMMDIRCLIDNFDKQGCFDTPFWSNNTFGTVCGSKIYSNIVGEVF